MANNAKDETNIPSCFYFEGKVVKTTERGGRTSVVQTLAGDSFLVSNAKLGRIPKCEHEGKHDILYCPLNQVFENECSNYFCHNYKEVAK